MEWQPEPGIDVSNPRHVVDLGIPEAMVHDIVLRQAVIMGRTSTIQLSRKLALSPVIMTHVVETLRDLRFLEVQGMDGRDYILVPTEEGRKQAKDRMQLSRYVGPAPVSLAAYSDVIRKQHASPRIDLAALTSAFSDLVISESLLRELGPAAIAGGAMFLYGPPGTGKSSIAERILRIYGDAVLVPYAVEVDGQIINVFDPVVHKRMPEQPVGIDARWVLCSRPCIIVGGELGPEMLDLQHQQGSGTYTAPVQMQANNGILVIDDFGRQAHLTPEALLNRWIVPLDRQRDHLTLEHGTKFDIPFDAKIVFSTNLQPETLGDEAFFRRIQSKVLIPSITDDAFDEVLRRVCRGSGIELTPDAPGHLRRMSRDLGDGDLRPYLPGSVAKILISICTFEDRPLVLDPHMIERVAHLYFTHTDDRGEEIPVAASARRPVAIPAGTDDDATGDRAHPGSEAPAPAAERVATHPAPRPEGPPEPEPAGVPGVGAGGSIAAAVDAAARRPGRGPRPPPFRTPAPPVVGVGTPRPRRRRGRGRPPRPAVLTAGSGTGRRDLDEHGGGTVVHQRHVHRGPEPTGGHRGPEAAQLVHDRSHQRFGDRARRRRRSTPAAGPCGCRRRG